MGEIPPAEPGDIYWLDRTENELAEEEKRDDGNADILLRVFAGEESDENVGDTADTDTVCDRVGKGHHDERQECGNCAAKVSHIDLGEVLEHENAYVDESGSGSSRRNDACKGSEEETNYEA